MSFADTLRKRVFCRACYPKLERPDKKNTLTHLIIDPFGALDNKSKKRYINHLKKMKQKYDISSNIFSDNYLNIRNKQIVNNSDPHNSCLSKNNEIQDTSNLFYTEPIEDTDYHNNYCCNKKCIIMSSLIIISVTSLTALVSYFFFKLTK